MTPENGPARDEAAHPRFLQLLQARVAKTATHLCLGLDPVPDALPAGFPPDVVGVERFARLVLNVAGAFASAVKPNLAYYEAFGSRGIAALERLRTEIPADMPVILDAKRADIGPTATRQASALFDALDADAVTASPYLGSDALEPLLARQEGFVYLLCRTSNASAGEFQDLRVEREAEAGYPPEPLYLRVARRARGWAGAPARLGLVVGATAPAELESVRRVAPDLAFLVPGVGAQGGDIDAVRRAGRAVEGPASAGAGGGLLVNVSRGITDGARDARDPEAHLFRKAQDWSHRLRC